MLLKRSLFLLSACAVTCVAMASVNASDYFPEQIQLGSQTVYLNGKGYHKMAFFKIYEAGLYLPQKSTTPVAVEALGGPKRARLLMIRAVSAENFVLVLRDGLVANTPKTQIDERYEEIVHFFDMMDNLGHLVEGDLVDLDFVNGQTAIRMNDKPFVTNLGDKGFYDMIINIWLGPKPLDAKLKKSLLANGS